MLVPLHIIQKLFKRVYKFSNTKMKTLSCCWTIELINLNNRWSYFPCLEGLATVSSPFSLLDSMIDCFTVCLGRNGLIRKQTLIFPIKKEKITLKNMKPSPCTLFQCKIKQWHLLSLKAHMHLTIFCKDCTTIL